MAVGRGVVLLFSPPAYPSEARVAGGQSYQEERPRMTPPLLRVAPGPVNPPTGLSCRAVHKDMLRSLSQTDVNLERRWVFTSVVSLDARVEAVADSLKGAA